MIGEEAVSQAMRSQCHPALCDFPKCKRDASRAGSATCWGKHANRVAGAISTHLAALKEAGWVMVPREPTREMLLAGVRGFQKAYSSEDSLADWRACWFSMISAAPPAQNGDEAKP